MSDVRGGNVARAWASSTKARECALPNVAHYESLRTKSLSADSFVVDVIMHITEITRYVRTVLCIIY